MSQDERSRGTEAIGRSRPQSPAERWEAYRQMQEEQPDTAAAAASASAHAPGVVGQQQVRPVDSSAQVRETSGAPERRRVSSDRSGVTAAEARYSSGFDGVVTTANIRTQAVTSSDNASGASRDGNGRPSQD